MADTTQNIKCAFVRKKSKEKKRKTLRPSLILIARERMLNEKSSVCYSIASSPTPPCLSRLFAPLLMFALLTFNAFTLALFGAVTISIKVSNGCTLLYFFFFMFFFYSFIHWPSRNIQAKWFHCNGRSVSQFIYCGKFFTVNVSHFQFIDRKSLIKVKYICGKINKQQRERNEKNRKKIE